MISRVCSYSFKHHDVVTTYNGEHYEFHGQCDLVLTKDENFADGKGIDIQVRTKLVRHWSYNQAAAVKIGDDILQVQGSADKTSNANNYWINGDFQGDLSNDGDGIGGFPITEKVVSPKKREFSIDLSARYKGTSIVVSTYLEFVRVEIKNPTVDSFGNSVGLLGDFKTGKTLARDGATVMNDFWEFGQEWQVLPSEGMLFDRVSKPQFPEKCQMPDDPRGERRRRLGEMVVSEEQAEAACAHLADAGDRKDCVYDVLATQDVDMVGAY